MALELQTIEEKKRQIEADVEAATSQTLKKYGIWFVTIFSTVIAGLSHLFDLLVVKALNNVFPSTTRDASLFGQTWAKWTKVNRGAKTSAVLNVIGTGVAGATIAGGINGRQFVSTGGVKFYLADNLVVPESGDIDTNVIAFLPGIDGNIQSGNLAITQQDSNLDNGVLTIVDIVTPGTNEEAFATWVEAVRRVLQKPVLADNYSYYHETLRQGISWVAAAYPYVGDPGTLELYIESKDTNTNGVPTDDQLTYALEFMTGDADEDGDGIADENVRVPLDLMELLPDGETPRLSVHASVPTEFYVIITGISDPAKQASVTTEVLKYFPTRKPFVKGVSTYNTGTLSQSDLRALVVGGLNKVGGGQFGDIVLYVADTDTAVGEYALGKGERARTDVLTGVRYE